MIVECIQCGEPASRGANGAYLSTGPGEAYCNEHWADYWHQVAQIEIGALSLGYEREPDASLNALFDQPTRFVDEGDGWLTIRDLASWDIVGGLYDGIQCVRCLEDIAEPDSLVCLMCGEERHREQQRDQKAS